jgi:MFS family permease
MTKTSYRNIALLAACQALLLTNAAALASMFAVVGYALVDVKAIATLPATTYVLGSALAAMPAALWMGRVGRRRGFMTGSIIGCAGCLVGAGAVYAKSFPLFCFATAMIGVYNAFGLQYRFAAAEVAAPSDKAKAISLVLAGGVVGGFVGPETTRIAKDVLATPFLGSFIALASLAVLAIVVQAQVHVPPPSPLERAGGGRPLAEILRQPVFVVAALAAALGYGIMNLLMVATPLAMSFCGHPFGAAAFVIEWHVLAMYAPGFVTGSVIARIGTHKVILIGVGLMAACVGVALSGTTIVHFVLALMLLGVGWNFMYTGGTTLLTEAYSPGEKSRTQGANDAIVFTTMGVSSFASGVLVSAAGWEAMNAGAVPLLTIVAATVLWHAWQRRLPSRVNPAR